MRLSTPQKLAPIFYVGVDTKAWKDDEQFGLSIGRLYIGVYNYVLHIGILDTKGCLP